MKLKTTNSGFGVVGAILISALVVVIGITSYLVTTRLEPKSQPRPITSISVQQKTTVTPKAPTGPYAGWKTYCDSTTVSCIQYPPDWAPVAGFPGAFESSTQTGYVSLIPGGTNVDEALNTAYICSVTNLNTSAGPLDIVGYIVSNQPGYVVYDTSYVSNNGIKVGVTKRIIDGNYSFTGKNGPISLVATPDSNGYAAITTFNEAQAWFTGADAQTDLKILESFYYQ